MLKKAIQKGCTSFSYAIAINVIIDIFMILVLDIMPLVPDYARQFSSEAGALIVQLFLIGCASGILAAGTEILELERLSLLAQSLLYFLLTLPVWLFVGCYCFQLHRYKSVIISWGITYIISYVVSWLIQYRLCKKQIKEINDKLSELTGLEEKAV